MPANSLTKKTNPIAFHRFGGNIGSRSASFSFGEMAGVQPRPQETVTIYQLYREARFNLVSRASSLVAKFSNPDWDGQGANPITPKTLMQVVKFVEALPSTIFAIPTVVPEPVGSIAFEWRTAKGYLTVSIDDDSYVYHYTDAKGSDSFGKVMVENAQINIALNEIIKNM